ncbi:hypothetical protein B0T19DRAFT_398450 [Cercophora scortea]|uniref:Uncharacterized protein n=1 Tax=Cercophora scortea TaxID=314031 RepID=A0AAE0IXF7_9PEZI|nr:hypothetical protein B0T19DRAFT_398450 [Cercophora scortea]
MAGTRKASGTALVRSFFFLAFLVTLALSDCYLPDGSSNPGIAPCVSEPNADVDQLPSPFASKLCCRQGHVCLLSGLCGQPNGVGLLYYRGGCSVNNWGDFDENGSDCPNFCSHDKKDNLGDVSQAYSCADDEAWWYCGSNPPDDEKHCKGAPHAYSLNGDNASTSATSAPPSSTADSSTTTSSKPSTKATTKSSSGQTSTIPVSTSESVTTAAPPQPTFLTATVYSPVNVTVPASTSTAAPSPTNAPSSASPSTSTIVGITVGTVSAVVIVALVLRSLLPMFGINSKSCCGMGKNRRGPLGRAESPPPLTDFGMKNQLEEFHGHDGGRVMQARRVELGSTGQLARPEVVDLPGNPQSFRRLPFDG